MPWRCRTELPALCWRLHNILVSGHTFNLVLVVHYCIDGILASIIIGYMYMYLCVRTVSNFHRTVRDLFIPFYTLCMHCGHFPFAFLPPFSFYSLHFFLSLLPSPSPFIFLLGVRILCFKISELCYDLMLTIYANYAPQISHYAPETCHYASKLNHFKSQTVGNDRPPSFSRYSMLSGSALVLLELSEASSPECSTSSPLLETVLNLVPEATLSDRLLVLQPGSLRFFFIESREIAHA